MNPPTQFTEWCSLTAITEIFFCFQQIELTYFYVVQQNQAFLAIKSKQTGRRLFSKSNQKHHVCLIMLIRLLNVRYLPHAAVYAFHICSSLSTIALQQTPNVTLKMLHWYKQGKGWLIKSMHPLAGEQTTKPGNQTFIFCQGYTTDWTSFVSSYSDQKMLLLSKDVEINAQKLGPLKITSGEKHLEWKY